MKEKKKKSYFKEGTLKQLGNILEKATNTVPTLYYLGPLPNSRFWKFWNWKFWK